MRRGIAILNSIPAFPTISIKPQRIQQSFAISTLPEDAMEEICDCITTNIGFNAVVRTGVPKFIPMTRSSE